MTRVLRPAAVAVLLLCCAQPATAQLLDDSDELLAAYRAIADEYRKGDDNAVRRLGDLGPSRLNALHQIMAHALRRPDVLKPGSGWTSGLLRAAAMLHTELALLAHEPQNIPRFRQHVEAADRVLQVAEQRDPGSDFRSRWQMGIGLHLLGAGDLHGAYAFLNPQCRSRTSTAPLRLACGVVAVTSAEWMRAPVTLDSPFEQRPTRAAIEGDFTRRVVGRDNTLAEAVAHFDAALAVDRSLHEASLRLAHAQIARRKDADAAPLLAPLAELKGPALVVYLARLMLGGIREREGNGEAAAGLYRRASELFPDAPSGRLALAHLLHARNDYSGARAIVERIVTPALRPPDDPWWGFHVRPLATPYPSVDDLRREARK